MRLLGLLTLAFFVAMIPYYYLQGQEAKDKRQLAKEVKEGTWQLSPYGPTAAEKQRRNMAQTGVNDVQIPLATRVEFARKHGLQIPTR